MTPGPSVVALTWPQERRRQAATVAAALASVPNRREGKRIPTLQGGCTIFFPHRTQGEPSMAFVQTQDGELYAGGVHHDGRPFTFAPDRSTAALIRNDIEEARKRSRPTVLDPESGVPA